MTKLKLKLQARELRLNGLGIKTIAHKLKVSSSTVNLWCQDIELNSNQKAILKINARNPNYGKRGEYLKKLKLDLSIKVASIRNSGIKEIGNLTRREKFLIGVGLYWAEGFKKDNRLGFANTDPTMIKFVLDWLMNICKVPKENIRLRVGINISHKNRIQVIENYWSGLTNISIEHFQKPYLQQFIWKKKFDNENNYFGVLRIRANKQLELYRKIKGWIEGIQINTAG